MLDYKDEVQKVISPISHGVRAVIPVPKHTNKLTSLYGTLQGLMKSLERMRRSVQDTKAEYLHQIAVTEAIKISISKYINEDGHLKGGLTKDDEAAHKKLVSELSKSQKATEKALNKSESTMDSFGEKVAQSRRIQLEIMGIVYQANQHHSYLYYSTSLPPQIPHILDHSFDFW